MSLRKHIEKEIAKLLEEKRIIETPWINIKYGKTDELRLKGIDKSLEEYKKRYPEYFI